MSEQTKREKRTAAFRLKNERRKKHYDPTDRQHREARRRRRLVRGAFGRSMSRDLALGTSAEAVSS